MSSTLPSSSSSAAASASTASPTPTSSSSTTSPPIYIGLIGVSFLTFCLVCIIKWHGISLREFRSPLVRNVNTRWPQNEDLPASGQPRMFDARMGECDSDGLKWEKSMVSIIVRLRFGGTAAYGNSLWTITAVLRDDLDGPRVQSYIPCRSKGERWHKSGQQREGEGTGFRKPSPASRCACCYAFATSRPITRWPCGVRRFFAR